MESLIRLSASYSSSVPFFALKPSNPYFSAKKPIVVCSARKKKKNRDDSHNFIPKPDEATGPFPESVLLKQKNVEKDGQFFPEFADDEEERVYQILKLQLEDGSEDEIMRHYEVVYLIHEKHAEEVESVNEKIKAFLGEKRGTIWRISDWGMRRLAYKIQKAKNAHYMLMNIEIDAKWINDFKTMLDKDERVIRHLVMKKDEAVTEDCPPPPEFHSLRAGMDDDDDEDDDDQLDEEDLEFDDEEYDDEEGSPDEEDVVVYVDGDEDDDGDTAGEMRISEGKSRAVKAR